MKGSLTLRICIAARSTPYCLLRLYCTSASSNFPPKWCRVKIVYHFTKTELLTSFQYSSIIECYLWILRWHGGGYAIVRIVNGEQVVIETAMFTLDDTAPNRGVTPVKLCRHSLNLFVRVKKEFHPLHIMKYALVWASGLLGCRSIDSFHELMASSYSSLMMANIPH